MTARRALPIAALWLLSTGLFAFPAFADGGHNREWLAFAAAPSLAFGVGLALARLGRRAQAAIDVAGIGAIVLVSFALIAAWGGFGRTADVCSSLDARWFDLMLGAFAASWLVVALGTSTWLSPRRGGLGRVVAAIVTAVLAIVIAVLMGVYSPGDGC
jgi:hypothetical protein